MSSVRPTVRAAALLLAAAFAAGVFLEIGVFFARRNDPAFVFLADAGPAQWIRHDRPMEMALIELFDDSTGFRTVLNLETPPASAVLRFRALTHARILVGDREVYAESAAPENWKYWREIDLAPYLMPGENVLTVVATRANGPPLLQAVCTSLGLATGPAWLASRDNVQWAPAATANRIDPVPGSRAFPRSDSALLNVAIWLVPVFFAGATLRWAYLRGRIHISMAPILHAVLLTALALLGLNAILRVPVWHGFDVIGHMEYIQFIVDHGRLPLAPDGWKMNEAPLFYLVAAIPYRFLYQHLTVEGNVIAMRVIPLLCALAQTEIALRTLRLVFPGHAFAQLGGAIICGLLPMNIYLSLFPSNQPFVGVWSALAVYFTLRHLYDRGTGPRWRTPLLAGLALGLAVLSKITGLLTAPGVLLGIASAAWMQRGTRSYSRALAEPAIAFAAMTAVCGWYFVRNQLALGTPFSVGFSESLDTVWRQDPGFRAPGQLLTFGEALWYPVSAGFVSYWDSIYSTFWSDGFISSGQVPPDYTYTAYHAPRPPSLPPWDFHFLCAGALLSLAPAGLILLGTFRTLARPAIAAERGTLLCLFWIGTHLAGMLYLYLTLPAVSAGKAAYLLNVLPCFGVLAAQGLVMLERRPVLSAAATGSLAAWAAANYAAFFVR